MNTETISVPSVHCGHCVASIEGALTPVAGVTKAKVDLDAKNVTVEHEDSVSLAQLVSLIEEQGYDVA